MNFELLGCHTRNFLFMCRFLNHKRCGTNPNKNTCEQKIHQSIIRSQINMLEVESLICSNLR